MALFMAFCVCTGFAGNVYAEEEGETTSYTVSFVLNGADNADDPAFASCNVNEGETVSAPEVTPTKEGYTFTGWMADDAGTAYSFEEPVTQDTVIYAGWESDGGDTEMVTVTFVSNGDQGTFTKEYAKGYELSTDEVYSDPDLAVTRTDETGSYELAYWDAFSLNTTYTLESDMTVTAGWLYTVKFETNGGTLVDGLSKNNKEFDSFVQLEGMGDQPNYRTEVGDFIITREGYTFGGWYLDPEFTTLADENYKSNFSGETAVVTIYAKWIANATNETTGRATPNTGANDHTRGFGAAALIAVAGAAVLIKKRREM